MDKLGEGDKEGANDKCGKSGKSGKKKPVSARCKKKHRKGMLSRGTKICSKANPDFNIINKYNITINSLRNQLKLSTDINELTLIASKIIELEYQILYEKTAGCNRIQKEKKRIVDHIDKMKCKIAIAEKELEYVEKSLDHKINGYKQSLQNKIDILDEDYHNTIKSNKISKYVG